MKFTLIASSIAVCALISCGQGNDDINTETAASATPVATESAAPAAAPAMQAPVQIPLNLRGLTAVGQPAGSLNPEHGKPGHRCDIAVGAPLNSAPAANTVQPIAIPTQASLGQQVSNTSLITAASGLNPEHGKPGHRCDIAVGAPLNSKPAPVAKTAPAVTPVAPGMNPQHGQPGHRCDIAVGAPLNSKPAPVAKTAPAVTPVAPGMNPQHGQPGHRCDIAVGAPLNSKPAPAATTTPASTTPQPEAEPKKDSASGR